MAGPLTEEMQKLIRDHSAGMVATVNDDGTPSVSPKATFVIIDESTLAFGNLRSPGTTKNISKRPAVELNFIDVLSRKAVRVTGTAKALSKSSADAAIKSAFENGWPNLVEHMSAYVRINVSRAEVIISPAYDHGATEAELRRVNLDKLNNL
jgi:general stress protein 26